MIPGTLNKKTAINHKFFEESGMQRIYEDTYFEEDLTTMQSSLNELYESQRNEMLHYYEKDDLEKNIEDNFYEYSALKRLKKYEIIIESSSAKIHVCAFHVNTQGKLPFLQFLMQKHNDQRKITFPFFPCNDNTDVLLKAYEVTTFMSLSYQKDKYMKYVGYLNENENYYLFFDASECDISIHDLYKNNDLWLLTIDELINTQKVCGNVHIDESVVQFFHDNSEFIYLQNSEMENFEIPVIAYVGTSGSNANFVSIFGEGKSDCKSMFGENYYFYDYQHAVKMAMDKYFEKKEKEKETIKVKEIFTWMKDTKPLQGNIIRFALFLGRMKVITNPLDNKPDNSRTTQELLKEDITCAREKHRRIVAYLKISDRDGSWKNEYDSVFLSDEILLDDESAHFHGTTYVVKEYEQQIPLTCHFLDAETMNKSWKKQEIYYII